MKPFARSVFGILSLVYFLNLLGILSFPLDYSWIGLLATVLGVWFFLECFDFPGWIWGFSLGAVLIDAFSDVFHLYSRIESWDRLVHFGGGIFVAFPLAFLLEKTFETYRVRAPWLFSAVILLALVSFAGTMYELLEYLVDKFYFGFEKTLGNGPDTVEDLILNLFGGSMGYTIFLFFTREKTNAQSKRSSTFVFS